MKASPYVKSARYLRKTLVELTFTNGEMKVVDLAPLMNGPVFVRAKQPAVFKKLFVDGGTVCWPNGADLAPEALYEAQAASNAA